MACAWGTIRYADQPGDGPGLADLLGDDSDGVALPPVQADAPLFVFFTSGSTGPAKGVTHTVETIGWMVANLVQFLGVTGDDVVLTTTSHSHLGGTSWALMAFAAGAPLAMATSIEGSEVYPLVRSAAPTMTGMLPSTLSTLLADHEATSEDFGSFRYVATAGDRASGDLETRFATLAGFDPVELYGMTEAIGIAMTPPRANEPGSAGPPGAGVELAGPRSGRSRPAPGRSRAPAGALPRDDGRLLGPSAGDRRGARGRLAGHRRPRPARRRGLRVVRRAPQADHRPRRSNIAQQGVEDALLAHPAVTRAGVVGIHDLQHGENVWAYVSLDPAVDPPAPGELIAFAAERVGYKAPEVVVVLDHVPVTAVGKTDRLVLKRLAAAQHDTDLVH